MNPKVAGKSSLMRCPLVPGTVLLAGCMSLPTMTGRNHSWNANSRPGTQAEARKPFSEAPPEAAARDSLRLPITPRGAPQDPPGKGSAPEPSLPRARLPEPPASETGEPFGEALSIDVAAPESRHVGSPAALRVSIQNRGEQAMEELAVRCQFDEALRFPGAMTHDVTALVGRLEAHETRELALTLVAEESGSHCCRFVLTGSQAGQTLRRELQPVCIEYVDDALEFDVVGPLRRTVGSRAELTLRVTNHGEAPLAEARLSLTYDKALVLREATQGGTPAQHAMSWNLGPVASRESLQVQVEFDCKMAARRACIAADVAAEGSPSRHAEACIEITEVSGGLDLRISDLEDPVAEGSRFNYAITVQNLALLPARDVGLEVRLPEALRFVSSSALLEGRAVELPCEVQDQKLVFPPLERLAPDARLVLDLRVEALKSGVVEVTATARSAQRKTPATASEPTIIQAR